MARLILVAGAFAAMAAGAQEPTETIAVLVYNYAGLEAGYLAVARQTASRILASASVHVQWMDWPRSSAENDLSPACRTDGHQVEFALRIRPGPPRLSGAFGLSYLDRSGNGAYADVYAEGAVRLAQADDDLRGVMLGHLMAHELGHLLLGSPAHSGTGIMQASWNVRALQQARQGGLSFLNVQAGKIAARLRTRPGFPRGNAVKEASVCAKK